MTALRKFCLGPARSTPCLSCGVPVSVSAWSFVVAIPFIVSFCAWLLLKTWPTIVAILVTAPAFGFVHQFHVPLVEKRKKGRREPA